MKLIIAGSRNIEVSDVAIAGFLDAHDLPEPSMIVSGAGGLMDESGERYALQSKPPKFLKRFPPDWEKHGKAAGPIRNREMAKYADVLLLVWDGESRGSKNMREEMLKLGKRVCEIILRKSR